MYLKSQVERLQTQPLIQFTVSGNSMTPRIRSGERVTVIQAYVDQAEKGDVVLCKVRGRYMLHLVTGVRKGHVQISNNHGHVNGWTNQVFGVVVSH